MKEAKSMNKHAVGEKLAGVSRAAGGNARFQRRAYKAPRNSAELCSERHRGDEAFKIETTVVCERSLCMRNRRRVTATEEEEPSEPPWKRNSRVMETKEAPNQHLPKRMNARSSKATSLHSSIDDGLKLPRPRPPSP